MRKVMLILSLLLVLGLVACGGGTNAPAQPTQPAADSGAEDSGAAGIGKHRHRTGQPAHLDASK